VAGHRVHLLLQADEVTRQQHVEDLAPAVGQCLVAVGPAAEQRVQAAVAVAFADQVGAGVELDLGLLEFVDHRQLFRLDGLERGACAQRAFAARAVVQARCVGAPCHG
jgi:hypothetical protein